MTRGALLFAFNSSKVDYYAMAEFTAKRIEHFLNLPVTVITSPQSIPFVGKYNFDKVISIPADTTNSYRNTLWLNKGRYRAYELSPYDETLLIDVDYIVNSDRLLNVFDYMDEFACHESTSFMMVPDAGVEMMSPYSYPTLWATVIGFKKTKKCQQIFECMRMVQENYQHYADIHGFVPEIFRNDYALTVAHKLVHGHLPDKRDILPWNLMHIGLKTQVYANQENDFNTEYTVVYDLWKNSKLKKEYITIKDMDFHTINKEVFLGLLK